VNDKLVYAFAEAEKVVEEFLGQNLNTESTL